MTTLQISDTHLNDGGPRENFYADELLADTVWGRGIGEVVVAGDFCEERQADWQAIWNAHPKVIWALRGCRKLVVLPGNHDPHIRRAPWWPPWTRFPGGVYVSPGGTIHMHGHQFDTLTGGPLKFVGSAATWLASSATYIFGSSADEWLARQAKRLFGYGSQGDAERYRRDALAFLDHQMPAKRIVLGHTHQWEALTEQAILDAHEDGALIPIDRDPRAVGRYANSGCWCGPVEEVEERFNKGECYMLIED